MGQGANVNHSLRKRPLEGQGSEDRQGMGRKQGTGLLNFQGFASQLLRSAIIKNCDINMQLHKLYQNKGTANTPASLF